jgi:hypothetical protein
VRVPQIDLIDETWIGVPLPAVAGAVADPANWRRWWPDFELEVDELRGPLGVRWWVRSTGKPKMAGSMEIWLEPSHEGVILHFFLRLDPAGSRLSPRRGFKLKREQELRAKRTFFGLKDGLEAAHPLAHG